MKAVWRLYGRAKGAGGALAGSPGRRACLCLITPLCSYLYGGLYGGLYERAHIIRYFPRSQARRSPRGPEEPERAQPVLDVGAVRAGLGRTAASDKQRGHGLSQRIICHEAGAPPCKAIVRPHPRCALVPRPGEPAGCRIAVRRGPRLHLFILALHCHFIPDFLIILFGASTPEARMRPKLHVMMTRSRGSII